MSDLSKEPKETIAYKGKMFAVVHKPVTMDNGKSFMLELARRAPGTRLIIETKAGNILLTKEWRPELNSVDIRLPGGKVFDSLDEYLSALATGKDLTPFITEAARKEALEEAGVLRGTFTWLAKSVSGLTVEWDLHFFAVTGITLGKKPEDEYETIETTEVLKEEARRMCLDGSMSEERSALQLLKYLQK
jgi:8-oxo-dGTP pyrophosphatase MutT (NUDIX family)